MENRSKREKIYDLDEQDNVYNVWQKSYEECAGPFREFVREQPEEIQNILYGYADCGRMMMQRIDNR